MSHESRDPTAKLDYQHEPLHETRSIRILELLPGQPGSRLQFRLREVRLGHFWRYEALSYVWGDPDLIKTIYCGSKVLRITKNCSEALHFLRHEKNSRYLWVDSICIDQTSPLERNHQVTMMGRVYGNAHGVIVWLGNNQTRNTDKAMTYIRHISKAGSLRDASQYARRVPALTEFFALPWFSRVWPVQEVAFSLACKIICGHYSIKVDELMTFLAIVKDFTMVNDYLHRVHVHRQMWRYVRHVKSKSYSGSYDIVSQLSSSEKDRRNTFKLTNSTTMLLKSRRLEATDPRDKIFAFHGLLRKLGANLPDPDYSISAEQVYRKAAAAAISHDGHLRILASITGERLLEGLPSWVPDWSDSHPITEIVSWADYEKSQYAKPNFRMCSNSHLLLLWGVEVDQIVEHSVVFQEPSVGEQPQNQLSEIEIIQGWLSMFKGRPLQVDPVEFFLGLVQKPWKRLHPQTKKSTKSILKYWIEGLESFKLRRSKYKEAIPTLSQCEDLKDAIIACAKKGGRFGIFISDEIVPFQEFLQTLLDRKVMFKTSNGRLGIASRALQDGDRIALFRGVNVPMIIRRIDSKIWEFVAPAYIYDAMQESSGSWYKLANSYSPSVLQEFVMA